MHQRQTVLVSAAGTLRYYFYCDSQSWLDTDGNELSDTKDRDFDGCVRMALVHLANKYIHLMNVHDADTAANICIRVPAWRAEQHVRWVASHWRLFYCATYLVHHEHHVCLSDEGAVRDGNLGEVDQHQLLGTPCKLWRPSVLPRLRGGILTGALCTFDMHACSLRTRRACTTVAHVGSPGRLYHARLPPGDHACRCKIPNPTRSGTCHRSRHLARPFVLSS